MEVAVVSLADTRGLRAALHGVDTIIHLAGAEAQGRDANLRTTDIDGTRNLVEAAKDAGVQHFIYLSHLDAARASAYPVFKAKGIAEETLRRSGVPYTILRSAVVYGPEDHFTTGLARMLRAAPGIFFLPSGESRVTALIQPIWVEDLVACILWTYENPDTRNQTYEVGGSEYFTIRQIVEILMTTIHAPRLLIEIPPVLLRTLTILLESVVPNFPASSFWIDYIFLSRTCPADSTSRAFGLMPARFTYRLDYLATKSWRQRLSDWFARLRPSRPRK